MTEAGIISVAKMLKHTPKLDVLVASPPDPRYSHLRCFFFFKSEAPDEFFHTRSRMWWTTLREVFYNMDKEYSRAVSKLAVPQLIKDINVLRDPEQAEQRFKFMALDLDLPWTPMEKAGEDNDVEDDEDLLA